MSATTTRTAVLSKSEVAARHTAAQMLHTQRHDRDTYPDAALHDGTLGNPAEVVNLARERCEGMAATYLTGGYNTTLREPFGPPDLALARQNASAADLLGAIYSRVLDLRDVRWGAV
jgi:hypothetical protein